MEEKFITIVDCVCSSCGYRNKIKQVTTEKVVVIACGECGNILKQLPEVAESDVPAIKEMLQMAIDGGGDVIL